MNNYESLKMPGMLGEFMSCALSKDGGAHCDYCNMSGVKCDAKRGENQRGCDFDWNKYFSDAEQCSLVEMAVMMSSIFYTMCDYCPVKCPYDEICDCGEGDEDDCVEAFEEWLCEENWMIEPLLETIQNLEGSGYTVWLLTNNK